MIKIGRQNINGLIQKTPHNANYRELYNVVLGLKNQPFYFYVTQAEYDALPQEEKDEPRNIYEITDSDGEFPHQLQDLIDYITFAKETYDTAITNDTNLEVVNARHSNVTGSFNDTLNDRLNSIEQVYIDDIDGGLFGEVTPAGTTFDGGVF